VLDAVTVRNLELIEPLFAGSGENATLFRCLDCTVTPMGKRLLRSWMLRPSIDAAEINRRLDAVECMVKDLVAREELRRSLDGILDLERLLSRVTLETANPRDLLALAMSLAKLPAVRTALSRLEAERLRTLHGQCDELGDLRQHILSSLEDEPPLTLADGGVIRAGVDAALDELRNLSRNSKQYIAQIEQRERQRTGIGSLKVKFNNVFGYYLEISKAESAPRARRLRTQADAGQRRALHHARAKGVRGQGAGRAGEDGRDRAASVCRIARCDCRRGAAHPPDRAGAGRDRLAGGVRITCRQP
jgi:DNA mismatch repair protein MutS